MEDDRTEREDVLKALSVLIDLNGLSCRLHPHSLSMDNLALGLQVSQSHASA